MKKRFEITVTEVGQEMKVIGREWEKGGEGDPAKYGYTPAVEAIRDYKREVYRQTVDELDLGALVSIVNNLKD